MGADISVYFQGQTDQWRYFHGDLRAQPAALEKYHHLIRHTTTPWSSTQVALEF